MSAGDIDGYADDRRLEVRIKDAVRNALVDEHISDHEKRIAALERFRWWLLAAVATAGISSSGSFLILLLQRSGH